MKINRIMVLLMVLLMVVATGMLGLPGPVAADDVSGHTFALPNGCKIEFVQSDVFSGGERGAATVTCKGGSSLGCDFVYGNNILSVFTDTSTLKFTFAAGDLYYIDPDTVILTADDDWD